MQISLNQQTSLSTPLIQRNTMPTRRKTRVTALSHHEIYRRATLPQNFTLRGLMVGLVIGIIVCFCNTYFGLQTGWVTGMAMPSALVGYAFFNTLNKIYRLRMPFNQVENVLIQSVSTSVGTMPLGCGFVGVIPALEFLLTREEGAPLNLSTWKLVGWAVGICLFGVVFAVPLRRQVILREKLPFPSGIAAAHVIALLHGEKVLDRDALSDENERYESLESDIPEQFTSSATLTQDIEAEALCPERHGDEQVIQMDEDDNEFDTHLLTSHEDVTELTKNNWTHEINALVYAVIFSFLFSLPTFFFPVLRNIPIFGQHNAQTWLWTFNPSPAYVGQGIIMGAQTTLHMLLGAILGWLFISPLAKFRGWAPGPVNDWSTGSQGWLVWISLAIMLADSLVSLAWLLIKSGLKIFGSTIFVTSSSSSPPPVLHNLRSAASTPDRDACEADVPSTALLSKKAFYICLISSIIVCIIAVQTTFPGLIPLKLTVFSLVMAVFLSLLGVRALGETDLNPVSGISKISQLLIILFIPSKAKSPIVINLVAGALSEAGAIQAGDLMQDLKAGHLLGASPSAQFWGQLAGSAVGAVVAAFAYKLYVNVYQVPSEMFPVPTAYVWIFTARLVSRTGLPYMAEPFAIFFGITFALITLLRIISREFTTVKSSSYRHHSSGVLPRYVQPFILSLRYLPGGIAVAIGMYNTPSFTLSRVIGGLIQFYMSKRTASENGKLSPSSLVIVIASGLILGEGIASIFNLLLISLKLTKM